MCWTGFFLTLVFFLVLDFAAGLADFCLALERLVLALVFGSAADASEAKAVTSTKDAMMKAAVIFLKRADTERFRMNNGLLDCC